MKFIVRVKSHLDEAEEYTADDIYELIDQLLDEWIAGDADMPGVFAFLADHDCDLGITDDEIDEGTDESVLQLAADAVRLRLHAGDDETLAVFLSAISSEYTIEEQGAGVSEKEDEADDDKEEADGDDELDEEYEKQLDEDYDY